MMNRIVTGGFRKIEDLKFNDPCRDPEHNPPTHIVLEDGIWAYTCPSCGREQTIRVSRPTLTV